MKFSFLFAFVIAVSFSACKENLPKGPQLNGNTDITKTVYQVGNGWGYRIYANGKIFIQQDFVPAVAGKNPFKTKEDAEKIAKLVMVKLQLHQRPFVTENELAENGVIP